MNKERFQGNWEQLKGRIRQRWGKLTDDDVQRVRGNWEEMVVRMRERYGIEKDLLDGKLAVRDLPEAWNRGMRDRLEVTPADAAEGCL